MAWSILVFCLVSFLATLLAGLGFTGLILFIVATSIYIALVQAEIQNEVESAVLCLMMLLLLCIGVPAVYAAREAYHRRSSETKSPVPESPK